MCLHHHQVSGASKLLVVATWREDARSTQPTPLLVAPCCELDCVLHVYDFLYDERQRSIRENEDECLGYMPYMFEAASGVPVGLMRTYMGFGRQFALQLQEQARI